ncbi:tRNA guanosine(34) transglycosylase Tgt [Candidatus Dojkabacteria bacterium]|nr:tRNA guanosine(34) transglycosylase Tgt [Candidatus Dojkabacteria bacterium]
MKPEFKVIKQSKSSNARVGLLSLPHGKIQTPCFMPDATYGFIKALSYPLYKSISPIPKMVVTNTLHTYLQIGIEALEKSRGINVFTGWDGPFLSDSGGFQVFSLNIKQDLPISEKGVTFKPVETEKSFIFTPELSLQIQEALNTDIRVVLDYFTPPKANKKLAEKSVSITTAWAERSKAQWSKGKKNSLVVAVVQGGSDPILRKESYVRLEPFGFNGFGFGGWPIVNKRLDIKTLTHFSKIVEPKYFKYAMGVGTPDDIKACIALGFDLFDTVLPTRNARHGYLYTSEGILRINNSRYKQDLSPVDPDCDCLCCKNYSRAELRALFKAKSEVAYTLATIHNLRYYEKVIELATLEILRE